MLGSGFFLTSLLFLFTSTSGPKKQDFKLVFYLDYFTYDFNSSLCYLNVVHSNHAGGCALCIERDSFVGNSVLECYIKKQMPP